MAFGSAAVVVRWILPAVKPALFRTWKRAIRCTFALRNDSMDAAAACPVVVVALYRRANLSSRRPFFTSQAGHGRLVSLEACERVAKHRVSLRPCRYAEHYHWTGPGAARSR